MNGFGLICAQGERWKVQRKFTLDFMRKFGMSKFNPLATHKIENKIKTCINEFFLGKFVLIYLTQWSQSTVTMTIVPKAFKDRIFNHVQK